MLRWFVFFFLFFFLFFSVENVGRKDLKPIPGRFGRNVRDGRRDSGGAGCYMHAPSRRALLADRERRGFRGRAVTLG